MTHKNDFLRKGPAGLVVVPLLFALVTLALLAVMFKVFAAPYYSLVEWFMETSVVETQPKDLFDEAAQTLTNTENDRTAQEEPEQETIPLSSAPPYRCRYRNGSRSSPHRPPQRSADR